MHQISAEETYRDGDVVFEQGSHGDWVYIILEGAVALYKEADGESVLLETLAAGEIFGEIEFIADTPRIATARAKGKTVLGIVDRHYLDEDFNRLSESFRQILIRLTERITKLTNEAVEGQLRRRTPRVPKVLTLSFRNRAGLIQAFSENLNAAGMFIKTASPLPAGERFFLNLQLPDHQTPIRVGCEVVWQRPASDAAAGQPEGMGVKFLQITSADREHIRRVLAEATQGNR